MAAPTSLTDISPPQIQSLRIRSSAADYERRLPHLLRLPREIRDTIYALTILDTTPLWHRRHIATCVHRSRDSGPERPAFSIAQGKGVSGCLCAKRRDHSLVFVNRQIYNETYKLFYSHNAFCFDSAASAAAFLAGLKPEAREQLRRLSIVYWRPFPSASAARLANEAKPVLWQMLARCGRLESLEFDARFLEDRDLIEDFLKARPATLTRLKAITLDVLTPSPSLYQSTLADPWAGKCFVWHEVEESIWAEPTRPWQWKWYSDYVRRGFMEGAARKIDNVRTWGDGDDGLEGRGLTTQNDTVTFGTGAFNGRERTVVILGLPSTPKERVRLAREELRMKKLCSTSDDVRVSPQVVALKKKVEEQRRTKRDEDLERERLEWEEKMKAREQRLAEEQERERKAEKKRRNRIIRSAEHTAKVRLAERKRVV